MIKDLKFTEGDPDKDFFEQNPHWRYLDSTQFLLRKFDEKTVSKIRWALYLILDPDSPYFRYSLSKRVEVVNRNYLKEDYYIEFDEINTQILNEDLKEVIDSYPDETMSQLKKDYYQREKAYQILVTQESVSVNLKLKADVQLKMAKIYEELLKAKDKFEIEKIEDRAKSRGTQQSGILFRK